MMTRIECRIGALLALAAGCADPRGTQAVPSSPTPAVSLADAIRLARVRAGSATIAWADVSPNEPDKFGVGFFSHGRLKMVEVDAASGEVVETIEFRGDDSFYPEVEAHMPSMKIDVDRAIEIALGAVAGGTAQGLHLGLAGDGPATTVTYYVTVQAGDEAVVKVIDLSTGEVRATEEAEDEVEEDVGPTLVEPGTVTRNFDDERTGALPEDWIVQATGPQSSLANWEAVEDGSIASPRHALALTRTNHDSSSTFNLCWTSEIRFGNGTIEISMKPVSGDEDQGGGPIWRAKDKNNYYVCRANPLEGNFCLYVVKDGERKQLASASAGIAKGEWHTIRVEQDGPRIECSLDGKKLLETIDSTFPEVGGLGLWTKADAVTSFDDLQVSTPSDPAGVGGR